MRNYLRLLKGTSSDPVIRYYEETYLDYIVLLGLRKHWGMHFAYYDDQHRSVTEGVLNLNRVLAEKVNIKAGMKVLDAGCGVGGSAIWLAKNRGAYVTGITIVEQQLNRARRLVKESHLEDKVDFLLRDYRKTGFPDNTFDVVWAIESMVYADNKKDFLSEACRVLKPGGRLIVADGFQIKEILSPPENKRLKKFTSGWAVPSLATASGFTRDMQAVGFKNVQGENISQQVRRFSRWLYRWSFIAYPIAKILEWTGLRSKGIGVGNVKAAFWQYRTLRENLWAYMIFTGEK